MKHRSTAAFWLGSIAFIVLSTQGTRAAEGGPVGSSPHQAAVIMGRVMNAATLDYLEGATVELLGTNRVAVTDREGRYLLNLVSPDNVTLLISFSGLTSQRINVTATAGQRVVKDVALTSEIYQLDKFVVAGERDGMAKAEALQRQAPNVKAVVSSDAFGNIADGNIGETLQQMAGISADYNGAQARGISMRGVSATLNSVTVDGQTVAQAQSGSGSPDRRFDLDAQPMGNLESIEVIKAPTPDMPGASIGGSVNLVTKSPFDRAGGRVINYLVGLSTQKIYHPAQPRYKQAFHGFGNSMRFAYSEIFGAKKNIGVSFSTSFNSQQLIDTTFVHAYELKAEPGPVFVNQRSITAGGDNKIRFLNSLNLAYKWTDETTILVNMGYNLSEAMGYGPVFNLNAARTLATVDANGNRTGGGPINPNYANGVTRVHAVAANSLAMSINANASPATNKIINPMVRHRFANGLEIDYGAGASNSYVITTSNPSGAPPRGNVAVSLSNIGWTVDRSQDTVQTTVRQTEGLDWTNLNNYTGMQLTQMDVANRERIYTGKFDLKKRFETRFPTYLKTGLNYKYQTRSRLGGPRVFQYTGPDGIQGTADDNRDLAQFLDTSTKHLAHRDFQDIFAGHGANAPFPNLFGVAVHKELHPELWRENVATSLQNRLLSIRKINEVINAAYVMGEVRLGKVAMMSGVRVEETRDKGEGPLTYISPAEAARRAAWGTAPVTEAESIRRTEAQFGNRRTNEGSYTHVLPGVHLRYEPLDGFLLRGSWSTGVGRPAYGSIIPLDTANDTTRTVVSNNPNLKPQTADSYDVTAEYYFRGGGLLSVGVFRKDIADYIYTDTSQIIGDGPENGYDGQYAGYTLSTSSNRGWARLEGLEASYQQQLLFLPHWASGFSASANFTALRTEGNYGTSTITRTGLPQFISRTANFGLGYRRHAFDLRLQATYRGRYLQADNANPALEQWRAPSLLWHWKSKYDLSRSLSLYFDVFNIFSEQVSDIYIAHPDRSGNFHTFLARYAFGITGRF